MSCGKKPLVKNWDQPRNLRVIRPSRYQQNEPSVRQHWRKVIKELELAHKDEKFWESSMETVQELVGPVVFRRLAKIFDFPPAVVTWKDLSPEADALVPSVAFFNTDRSKTNLAVVVGVGRNLKSAEAEKMWQSVFTTLQRPSIRVSSTSDVALSASQNAVDEEEEELALDSSEWSMESSMSPDDNQRQKRLLKSKSLLSRSISRLKSGKLSTRSLNRSFSVTHGQPSSDDESPDSADDLQVHPGGLRIFRLKHHGRGKNPHFDLLYCTESESDMIKWDSNIYERKKFFVSESDEFSKKAEILTKQIARDFYEWWIAFGTDDYKSEIKRPGDIEDLFQVWFDEHISRGLILYPKIIPCVLKSIANYVGVPKKSCANVLKRQIAWDIRKETRPEHTRAFGRALPKKMKHIPPKNNTSKLWRGVKIPEDLRSMSCVWADIHHLTSTKAFHEWLTLRPHLPMPPCLRELNSPEEKQTLFQVPSDYVQRDHSTSSIKGLNLPVSQFEMEMKEVLDKLMD